MTRLSSLLPIVVLALSFPAWAQDSGSAQPLSAFVPELDRLIAAIEAAAAPADAASVAAALPERWHVQAGGQVVEVHTRWLTKALASAGSNPTQWPTDRDRIRRRLVDVRAQAIAFGSQDAGEARARARTAVVSILARDEFQASVTSRWREQIWERFERWFGDLWSRFGGRPGTSRRVAIGLAWVTALAALGGLAFWLARSIAERPRAPSLNLSAAGVRRPRARELALRALAEARAGNTREAVRSGYNAALVRLEEQGAWKVDEARTPREYLPMLRSTDAHRAVMLDLTDRFEQIWYGNRDVSLDDTPRVTAHLETLGCLRPGERAT